MLWGIQWIHIHLMTVDAAVYKYDKEENTTPVVEPIDKKKKLFSNFLSNLD